MLAEAGGIVADRVKPEKGGACKCWVTSRRREWAWIVKVNKVSVTVLDNCGNGGKDFTRTIPFEVQGFPSMGPLQTYREFAGVEKKRIDLTRMGMDALFFTSSHDSFEN
jgi:hypothetical protein